MSDAVTLNVFLPQNVHDELKAYCKNSDTTITAFAVQILREVENDYSYMLQLSSTSPSEDSTACGSGFTISNS
jgi:hypothetical protein